VTHVETIVAISPGSLEMQISGDRTKLNADACQNSVLPKDTPMEADSAKGILGERAMAVTTADGVGLPTILPKGAQLKLSAVASLRSRTSLSEVSVEHCSLANAALNAHPVSGLGLRQTQPNGSLRMQLAGAQPQPSLMSSMAVCAISKRTGMGDFAALLIGVKSAGGPIWLQTRTSGRVIALIVDAVIGEKGVYSCSFLMITL
jgi:hypothetical protein